MAERGPGRTTLQQKAENDRRHREAEEVRERTLGGFARRSNRTAKLTVAKRTARFETRGKMRRHLMRTRLTTTHRKEFSVKCPLSLRKILFIIEI